MVTRCDPRKLVTPTDGFSCLMQVTDTAATFPKDPATGLRPSIRTTLTTPTTCTSIRVTSAVPVPYATTVSLSAPSQNNRLGVSCFQSEIPPRGCKDLTCISDG